MLPKEKRRGASLLILALFLANVQRNFAEFLKDYYANTLVFSTYSLVSVLVQFYKKHAISYT